jgi:hypothetical protein
VLLVRRYYIDTYKIIPLVKSFCDKHDFKYVCYPSFYNGLTLYFKYLYDVSNNKIIY